MLIDTKLLFPTPVYVFKYDGELTKRQMLLMKSLTKIQNGQNRSSENYQILKNERLKDLNNFCCDSFKEAFKKYNEDKEYPAEIYITQSWANYSSRGEAHHQHWHPNSYLSGVFYVDTVEGDSITFHNINVIRDCLVPDIDYQRKSSRAIVTINVEKNTLIIFPSWLRHSVRINNKDHTRISIAMNSFLRGVIGDESGFSGIVLDSNSKY